MMGTSGNHTKNRLVKAYLERKIPEGDAGEGQRRVG
jgi:hypothetical protein